MKNLHNTKLLLSCAAIALLLIGCAAPEASTQSGEWTPNPPNPNAPYPADSRASGEQGTVMLRVRTSPDGRPLAVTVQQSSGYERPDRSAVDTVWKWKFKPTPDDGTVVWREVPVRFVIR